MLVHYLILEHPNDILLANVGRYWNFEACMSAGLTYLERGWEGFRIDSIVSDTFRVSLNN